MNLTELTQQMSQVSNQMNQSIAPLLSDSDIVNNPDKMLQLQFAIQQYSAFKNVESGVMKTVKDLVATITNRAF
ncbi:EscF/YscF/HrpA family type III secretion system needle major subunit [Salmonella enterica subsp. enterica serovar Give]|nr:EscF/YscF/HrpA family type III secretion system needle major subunit [Salmonella enterica subsp. enterica serovar Give]MII49957.1 EscF/YscF/HrpA family type III secretion system needle major subunit [Salmonella enterica subsp. enterica serovar Bredeney]